MRILHLIKKFNFGGAENHVRDLANVMAELGNDVFVISTRGNQNALLDSRVNFIQFSMSDFLLFIQVPMLVQIIRKHRIEVLHAHQRLPALLATIAASITGIPVVVTIHGQTQHDLRSSLTRKVPKKFIYVRQSTFDEAAQYGIPSGKSVLIQNGVTITRSSILRDTDSVCYISRIDKRHASVISLIIKKVIIPLINKYPGITFRIVGDGDSLDKLKSEANVINSQIGHEAIIFSGYIPNVKEIVTRSGLVLGVGRVAIETLACGVPLLSVNYKCLGELASAENYQFLRMNNFVSLGFNPPDDRRLIEQLEKYFENKIHWQTEAAALQNKIEKDFNIYTIGTEIIDLYKDIIARVTVN